MDRNIVYPGAIPLDTDLLSNQPQYYDSSWLHHEDDLWKLRYCSRRPGLLLNSARIDVCHR